VIIKKTAERMRTTTVANLIRSSARALALDLLCSLISLSSLFTSSSSLLVSVHEHPCSTSGQSVARTPELSDDEMVQLAIFKRAALAETSRRSNRTRDIPDMIPDVLPNSCVDTRGGTSQILNKSYGDWDRARSSMNISIDMVVRVGLVFGLLGSACSFQAGRLVAWPTQCHPRYQTFCGATADFLVSRFDCTEAVATRAEGRLLPNVATSMTLSRAAGQCEALQVRLGLSEAQLQKVVVALPSTLALSFESNIEPSLAKLQARLGLSEAQLQKVVVALPAVLGYSFESNIKPSLAKLQARLRLSEAQLQKVVVALPAVLGYCFESNIEPSLAKLQARLGLSEVQLQKVVVALPQVLSYSFESNIEPSLAKLQARLGLSEAQLQKMVVAKPSTLAYSFESNIEPSLAKLQARLRLSEAQLQKMVVATPAVLGYSFESNIEPSLSKLQTRLGLSEAQLQKVVVALPSVLGYSFESNLSPKLDFLERELALPLEVLRERVLRRPALLGYSQAKRYQPRLKVCCAMGVAPIIVIDRITLTDVRFNASIGL
jgi:hypothetical protein